MPPRLNSRYQFSTGLQDANGNLFLTDRTPYRFKDQGDNRFHTVVLGETLWTLAEHYFDGIADPANLWWIIADFQPDPIFDATIALTPGRVMAIPSIRLVLEEIFNQASP